MRISSMAKLSMVSILLTLSVSGLANTDLLTQIPFGKKVSLAKISEAAKQKSLTDLIKNISSQKIQIYKINLADQQGDIKPELEALSDVPKDLKEFILNDANINSIMAVALSKNDIENPTGKDVFVVSTKATAYDLIHEYTHILFARELSDIDDKNSSISLKKYPALEKSFKLNFAALISSPEMMAQEHIRKGFLEKTEDYMQGSVSFLKRLPVEEISIEFLLAQILRLDNSIFYSQKRVSSGSDYAKSNMNRYYARYKELADVADWLTNDVYAADTALEIPTRERIDGLKRSKALVEAASNLEKQLGAIGNMLTNIK